MEFPRFFETSAANVPAHQETPDEIVDDPRGLAPDWVQPYPAPWFVDPPRPSDGDIVTTIVIPDGDVDFEGPPIDIEEQDWGASGFSDGGADAIACYIPWHADPRKWGIYFFQRPFFAFVREIAASAGLPPDLVAPVVLRQVLFHELEHFRFEVVGSELEDVLGRGLYLDYLRLRFGRPAAGLSGPVEESLATWREVRFARGKLQGFLRPKPPSYLPAVMAAATAAPPGYRDWNAAASDRGRERLVAAVASLIAGHRISTGGWGNWLSEENKQSVPRHWVGDPRFLPSVRALEKTAPQVTIRHFERWLKSQGITPIKDKGKGSHRSFEYAGRREGYGTSGGNDRLYLNDAKRLYKFFGYATVADFLTAVGT
jgi:hypothetical protein